MISKKRENRPWLISLSRVNEKADVVHAVNPRSVTLKVDNRKGIGVIIDP